LTGECEKGGGRETSEKRILLEENLSINREKGKGEVERGAKTQEQARKDPKSHFASNVDN
jgi:hypothetical protein